MCWCVQMHVCACMLRSERSNLGCHSSGTIHLDFETVSLTGTWASFRLVWLVNDPQESCLCLPQAGTVSEHYAQLFM